MFKVVVSEGSVPIGTKGYHKQAVWVFLFGENGKPAPYPTEFPKLLSKDEKPLTPGEYAIAPHSFAASVDERGNRILKMTRLHLLPLPANK